MFTLGKHFTIIHQRPCLQWVLHWAIIDRTVSPCCVCVCVCVSMLSPVASTCFYLLFWDITFHSAVSSHVWSDKNSSLWPHFFLMFFDVLSSKMSKFVVMSVDAQHNPLVTALAKIHGRCVAGASNVKVTKPLGQTEPFPVPEAPRVKINTAPVIFLNLKLSRSGTHHGWSERISLNCRMMRRSGVHFLKSRTISYWPNFTNMWVNNNIYRTCQHSHW